jgi:hypothetical protein
MDPALMQKHIDASKLLAVAEYSLELAIGAELELDR